MSPEQLEEVIARGESQNVEFKRCGAQKPGTDVFETICSFANRDGGSIYLGVCDDGSVEGIPTASVLPIRRNIVNVINDGNLFSAPPAVEFEDVAYQGKNVIRIWVPAVQGVFRFKGQVYDRMADADVRLRSDAQISSLYLRKYNLYTEQHIFPHLALSDLRGDLIERARKMAVLNRPGHPWGEMDDMELLRSAQLWSKDIETGREGLNRACALLLGTDETIRSACPAYKTDAIYRMENADRYDDRVVVRTNLIESFDLLCAFCEKHLPDPFHLEGMQRVSVRDIVVRELVSNILIHREFTSPYPARLVIDRDGVRTENASRALFGGRLSLDKFNPVSKNPIIAGFFSEIGYAEELGSGVRNLSKYARLLLGADPVLEEGDVFVACVPRAVPPAASAPKAEEIGVPKQRTLDAIAHLFEISENVSVADAAEAAGVSEKTATKYLKALVDAGFARAVGEERTRSYKPAKDSGGVGQS